MPAHKTAHRADNYAKLYATREGAKPIHLIWPYASGTPSELLALDAAKESREFHRSNGWKARISVWRHTPETRAIQATLIGQGLGTLVCEWREPKAAVVKVAVAREAALSDESDSGSDCGSDSYDEVAL